MSWEVMSKIGDGGMYAILMYLLYEFANLTTSWIDYSNIYISIDKSCEQNVLVEHWALLDSRENVYSETPNICLRYFN